MNPETCPSCHQPLPADAPAGLCPACVMRAAFASGPAPVGPSLDELRGAFPHLEILECIGRGGMGIVYKARQPHLDRLVALKILAPGLQADPGFAERFTREARTLAKLTHPNLVAVHDFGESGGFYYLLMEYVDGVNLRQAMQAARFTPEQALGLIPDLCAALQFAHDQGVLHRDIKPENILLDTKGRVKIADFGIARLLGDEVHDFTLTATGAALGTAAYMAPEQIEHPQDVDHRADIYSLGVVFYEMLTGGLPLGRFPPPSEKSTSDPRLDEVVFRALEKERERRYQSAGEVNRGVETACSSHSTPSVSPPPLSGDSRDPQSKGVVVSLGLLVGGVAAAIAGVLISELLLGLGITAFVLGLGGSWWLLARMKAGGYPVTHRKLLFCLTCWPMVVALFVGGTSLGIDYTWDVAQSRSISLWWTPILFFLVAFAAPLMVSRLMQHVFAFRFWPAVGAAHRKWWVAGSLVLLAISIMGEKMNNDQVRARSMYRPMVYWFLGAYSAPLKERDTRMVKEAVAAAVRPYEDRYRISFNGDSQVRVLLESLSKNPVGSDVAAFRQRLKDLLPPRFRIETGSVDDWRVERVNLELSQSIMNGFYLTFLAPVAGLLALGAGGRGCSLSLRSGCVLAMLAALAPAWPRPSILPGSMEGVPPLPQLSPISPPQVDFSVPESAVRGLYELADFGKLSLFRPALSEKLRSNEASAESLMATLNEGFVSIVDSPVSSDPNYRRFLVETPSGVHVVELTRKDGRWGLNSLTSSKNRATSE